MRRRSERRKTGVEQRDRTLGDPIQGAAAKPVRDDTDLPASKGTSCHTQTAIH